MQGRKGALTAKRIDPVWKCVRIVDESNPNSPVWQCLGCGVERCGSATRIADHVLGLKQSAKCAGVESSFLSLVDAVRVSNAMKETKKRKLSMVKQSNASAHPEGMAEPALVQLRERNQPALDFNTAHKDQCDAAVAAMFYACNVPASVVDHPSFKEMIRVLKTAPSSYKPPSRQALYGNLLNTTVHRLQRELEPLRLHVLGAGCTLLSDGWDNVVKDHLINFLFGNAGCVLFDGTVKVLSDDSENASFVAELLRQCMERQGRLCFVQVVTDTCSTMKAAWKILTSHYPWLTSTCCGTHVLSLQLKDFAKLPEVANIIAKVSTVLSLFWGRTRWPRTKLREVIEANHGKSFGLYRAKATRFAGKFREMSRMLRCKADLQQVVVTSEYGVHKFASRGRAGDDDDVLDANIGQRVKAIVLDEAGFWKPMTLILFVAMPIIKLLRMLDSNKFCIGKVYDRMFAIGERIKTLRGKVPWFKGLQTIHAERWEYLHSPFHAAAYALDPEFMNTAGELDAATMEGLNIVFDRFCLRDAILASVDHEHAWKHLNCKSPEVVSRVAQVEREFSTYQNKEGTFSRPSAIDNASEMEPSRWWTMYGKHVPMLASIAQQVLSQPAAASAAERNWSVYGQIHSQNRARMRHATADKLVYCHETMHVQRRVQDAGWAADVVKWDSDSDSSDDDAQEAWLADDAACPSLDVVQRLIA